MITKLTQEPGGTWFPLHSEVVMENGQILCTRNPTGHRVLIDYRFELPCGESKNNQWQKDGACYVYCFCFVILMYSCVFSLFFG